jgi:hypothetical protein
MKYGRVASSTPILPRSPRHLNRVHGIHHKIKHQSAKKCRQIPCSSPTPVLVGRRDASHFRARSSNKVKNSPHESDIYAPNKCTRRLGADTNDRRRSSLPEFLCEWRLGERTTPFIWDGSRNRRSNSSSFVPSLGSSTIT